ncbi:hypothetical protein B1H10_03885 [candidate division KSB1 bacterium 4484_188]|nr:MAG: hypothetical protein B1H10_03885 [candidate division KSB1 bacterium 4484_188]
MKPEEKEILEKLQTARQLYQEQKFPRAIELFEQLAGFLRDDEENLPIIQIELAWSYYYNQSYQKAIDNLQQALKSAKLTPQQEFDCYRIIGFSYEILGQLKQKRRKNISISSFKTAVTIKPQPAAISDWHICIFSPAISRFWLTCVKKSFVWTPSFSTRKPWATF